MVNMSSKNYWTKIREIAIELNKIGEEHLDQTSLDKLVPILDEIEVIAHDDSIDYESAKLILSDEGMIDSLETIRDFYIYIGARLERENAYEIIQGGENAWEVLDTFHFYERYEGLQRKRQLRSYRRTDERCQRVHRPEETFIDQRGAGHR